MNDAFFIVLLVLNLSSYAHAAEHIADTELENLPWRVDSVVTGGLWHRSDAFGECRLVVASVEWAEYTTNQVFIQWLRVDHPNYRRVVERTVRVTELDNYCVTGTPRHLAEGPPRRLIPGSPPPTHGERFEIIASPTNFDDDAHFIITPHPDHTYSFTRASSLSRAVFSGPAVCGLAGLAIGSLLTYATLHNRNRNG